MDIIDQSLSPELIQRLRGLHQDKVALITGGSVGIGREIGRLLALSGAYVMLAARRAADLEAAYTVIVAELHQAGFEDAEQRVAIEAGCDVGDPAAVARLADAALARFGHVDYLINNAGVVGPESMVMDMPVEGWQQTLQANMNSNYALIRRLAPGMKARGGGHVINVSSYFGGEKYMAIAYPNRADYAASKAGQRAMVEALARFLGPEIKINAVAPGPVDGDRLRGTAERPGIFERRARNILDNKRLGDVYAALITAYRAGNQPLSDLLPALLANDVAALLRDIYQPEALRRLAGTIWDQSDPEGTSRTCLLNEPLARKLLRRLHNAGHIADGQLPASFRLPPADAPFFSAAEFEREARKVRERIVGMLHLRRMPRNIDVALSTVYHLADRFVTGETFHTSGGLRFERTVTEGELFGEAPAPRMQKLRGATVFLVGEQLHDQLASLTRAFIEKCAADKVVLLSETTEAASRLLDTFPDHRDAGRLVAHVTGATIEEGIAAARATHGTPNAVVSTPFRLLPRCKLADAADGDWSDVLDEEGFVALVDQQLTHHIRVARQVALMDETRLVLVTPPTTARSSEEEFALANFVKTTLHAFTATFGAETERTIHHGGVNQVDLTRRARDEEPRGAAEEAEELDRFVDAVLLTSAPLPSPSESRYRSRIYRGNAITV